MKTIQLYGDLQAFKPVWQLDVKTPGEALRAIEANRPGFLAHADAGDYAAFLFAADNPERIRRVNMETTSQPWGDEVLMIVPRAGGDIPAAMVVDLFFEMGIVLGEASGFIAMAVTAVINMGLSMAFSALANIVTGSKQSVSAANTESYENKPSFISNGPVNIIRAGHPYPLIAGRFLCGSIVLSSQVHIQEIPV
jgi:predicted phage tail protein